MSTLEKLENGNATSETVRMTSGNSEASYAINSERQGLVFRNVISEPFENLLRSFARKNNPDVLRVADLGCATGQNTLSQVDFVVKTLKSAYKEQGAESPEFQVFFNDTPVNDFNDLSVLLGNRPDPDEYFANSIPRSFYNVLFPKASVHVCFSTMALHWLSGNPESLRKSGNLPMMKNIGSAWINGGSPEIAQEYAKQAQSDLREFFKCRAEEMATGGIMLLCCMGRPDSYPPHRQVDPKGEYCGPEFDAAWNDLVREGLVTQDAFDGFNLPMYFPNAQEVREAVESTGSFEVEMGKVEEWARCMEEEDFLKWVGDYEEFGKRKATFVRSFVGSLVEESLGAELADFLFQRMEKRCSEFLEKGLVSPSPFATITIATLVKK